MKSGTSKQVLTLLAQMSRRASSDEFAVPGWRVSPLRGCKWGSMPAPRRRQSREWAKKNLIPSCRWAKKPPVLQILACSTLKDWPQTQLVDRFLTGRQTRKANASLMSRNANASRLLLHRVELLHQLCLKCWQSFHLATTEKTLCFHHHSKPRSWRWKRYFWLRFASCGCIHSSHSEGRV